MQNGGRIAPRSLFSTWFIKDYVFAFSAFWEGDGGDGGGGGRISCQVQARYSIAPRDQISRSGNPLTMIYIYIFIYIYIYIYLYVYLYDLRYVYLYRSEGIARTGYLIPGCDGIPGLDVARNSSVAAVTVVVTLKKRGKWKNIILDESGREQRSRRDSTAILHRSTARFFLE